MTGIRVLLVDRERLRLESLRVLLDCDDQFDVVLTAQDGPAALRQLSLHKPHVTVFGLRDADPHTIETARAIHKKYPEAKLIILASGHDSSYMREALLAGVRGYLSTEISAAEFKRALSSVHHDGSALSQQVANDLLDLVSGYPPPGEESLLASLTKREREILELVESGRTTEDIAGALQIKPKTVRNFLSQIYAKLGTSNRLQTVLYVQGMAYRSIPRRDVASARARQFTAKQLSSPAIDHKTYD
jgi:DNA-binding NarL/FixJ family response regulator